LTKTDERTIMDASSVAKGYACDVIAGVLRAHGVTNYMVEIGGEIALNGVNDKGSAWSIGINKPTEDPSNTLSEIDNVLQMTSGGMATSGNYRNFYYKDGKRVAHTIDPRTGYPVQQDILSSTVVAADCMTADAYATAFMVLGKERSLEVLAADTSLSAYFIVSTGDTTGAHPYDIVYSPKMKAMLKKPRSRMDIFAQICWKPFAWIFAQIYLYTDTCSYMLLHNAFAYILELYTCHAYVYTYFI
jgi:thiamine biosynthesis lipoprotein